MSATCMVCTHCRVLEHLQVHMCMRLPPCPAQASAAPQLPWHFCGAHWQLGGIMHVQRSHCQVRAGHGFPAIYCSSARPSDRHLPRRGRSAGAAQSLPAAPPPPPPLRRCPGTLTWNAPTCARTSWGAAARMWTGSGSGWAWRTGRPCPGPPLAHAAGRPVLACWSCLVTRDA